MTDGDETSEPWRRRPVAPPKPLGDALSEVARRRGWVRRLEDARVHLVWEDIAGAPLAAHTEPVRLHGGVLVVRADSGTWATQVRYLTAVLLERANETLGAGRVQRVTVVTGTLGGPASPGGRPGDEPRAR